MHVHQQELRPEYMPKALLPSKAEMKLRTAAPGQPLANSRHRPSNAAAIGAGRRQTED
jgi:hypothetical protein